MENLKRIEINPSIDGGEYLAYSWRVPEAPLQNINENINTRPIIQILQDGQLAQLCLAQDKTAVQEIKF